MVNTFALQQQVMILKALQEVQDLVHALKLETDPVRLDEKTAKLLAAAERLRSIGLAKDDE